MIVRDMRKKKGLTQAELARQVQVAQSMICSVEKGKRKPSVALAKRIGAVLDFDWAMLYDERAGTQGSENEKR